jgi:lactoylglutathione lyase
MASLSYTIVFVSDMKRSVVFYRDIVGLPLKFDSPHWSEFDTGATTLALHQSALSTPAPAGNPSPPGACSPGIRVDDLDAFHAAVAAKGVRCIAPPTKQDFGRLAAYADPDGLAISVAEMTTDTKW